MENLPYEHIRWIENEEIDLDKLSGTSDMKKNKDLKGRPLLLFVNDWSIRMTQERNEGPVSYTHLLQKVATGEIRSNFCSLEEVVFH